MDRSWHTRSSTDSTREPLREMIHVLISTRWIPASLVSHLNSSIQLKIGAYSSTRSLRGRVQTGFSPSLLITQF